MQTRDFDYHLPSERIAQSPAVPRDSCRLLVLDRASGLITHHLFSDIIDYLAPGDLLIVNETKVMPARITGARFGGGEAEVLLLRRLAIEDDHAELWEALVRPGKRLKPGARVSAGPLSIEIVDWASSGERGQRIVRLVSEEGVALDTALHSCGKLPLPPYITEYDGDPLLYQTVYAQQENSAAAPTAGLHFTPELMDRIRAKGIRIETVNLAVGLDTFRPISEERIEDHSIHTERFSVNLQVIDAINETRSRKQRVVAVGTTSVRSLESSWDEASQRLVPRLNETTSLYITPGYQFKAIDSLLTNFHVPRSTLLVLVSAFASRSLIMKAYAEAVTAEYRFLSFGDAMLVL